MPTQSSNINDLYSDVVADLIAYYDNAVLLPNPQLIVNNYNLTGAVGNTMKIPRTNAWPAGNTSVGDNTDLINNGFNFETDSVSLSVSKKSAGTTISEESLEDGGFDVVRNAVLTRLSRSIAQATDQSGFNIALSGSGSALANLGVINVTNDGKLAGQMSGTCDIAVVMSPEALGYAVKREPTVKMFNDIQNDNHDMVATVRNGFAQIGQNGASGQFIRAVASQSGIGGGANVATLDHFSTSVANLRGVNAPTDLTGFYYAVISPAQELDLAKELNGIGASSGSIGSVSQDLANDALLQSLITQAIGLRFARSNNIPTGIALS